MKSSTSACLVAVFTLYYFDKFIAYRNGQFSHGDELLMYVLYAVIACGVLYLPYRAVKDITRWLKRK